MHATLQKIKNLIYIFRFAFVFLVFCFVIVLAKLKIEGSAFLSSRLYRNLCYSLTSFLYSKRNFKFIFE